MRPGGGEQEETPEEAPPVPQFSPVGHFPIEQSRDNTLCSAFDQVIRIDALGWVTWLTFPQFMIIKDRLYRVTLSQGKT